MFRINETIYTSLILFTQPSDFFSGGCIECKTRQTIYTYFYTKLFRRLYWVHGKLGQRRPGRTHSKAHWHTHFGEKANVVFLIFLWHRCIVLKRKAKVLTTCRLQCWTTPAPPLRLASLDPQKDHPLPVPRFQPLSLSPWMFGLVIKVGCRVWTWIFCGPLYLGLNSP